MTFWHGIMIGWFLGMVTVPFLMLVVVKLIARSFDRREREKKDEERMNARWLRQRAERGAYVSPEARRWLEEQEKGNGK